jgi:RNA polymerase sigma-70 factor (ECF subfamily)
MDNGEPADLVGLATASRGGDSLARDRFLAVARPLMLRWAGRLVDDPSAAEDVVQDALLEVCRTLATLREPAAVARWLHLAVRKHAHRHRRGRTSGMVLDLDISVLEPVAAGGILGDPGEVAERAGDRALIRRALAHATDADRLLLVLRYYGGWPHSDLAALLGISEGAVRKRLHDARRRLSARMEFPKAVNTPLIDPWEELMTDVRSLLGATYELDHLTPALPPGRPPLSRPTSPERLQTGIKVLDTLVPLPRGGVVDLAGPIGTGHLALLAEILRNLGAGGPAALVAVSSGERPAGVATRLWKLRDAEAPAAGRTAVITAPPGREAEAVDLAGLLAAWLAHGDATALLVIDEATARLVGPGVFGTRVGTCGSGPGSVTGVRVAPHPAGGPPAPPWPDADAEIRTGTAEMVTGRLPAVDVLASRSALLDSEALRREDRLAGHQARDLLARAAEIHRYLVQPFHIAEPATGVPGLAIPADEAIAGLVQLLDGSLTS